MYKNTTLKDLTQFCRNEKFLLEQVGLLESPKKKGVLSPSQKSIDAILNYSKILSIRKSTYFGFIEMILN